MSRMSNILLTFLPGSGVTFRGDQERETDEFKHKVGAIHGGKEVEIPFWWGVILILSLMGGIVFRYWVSVQASVEPPGFNPKYLVMAFAISVFSFGLFSNYLLRRTGRFAQFLSAVTTGAFLQSLLELSWKFKSI